MRRYIVTLGFLAAFFSLTSVAVAQEERHEISVQGTGSFTKDSNGNGIEVWSTSGLISVWLHSTQTLLRTPPCRQLGSRSDSK